MNRIGDNLISFHSNEGIVEAFIEHQVEFLVVGGLAVSWYCSDRQAADMDLMVRPTLENAQRIRDALDWINQNLLEERSFTELGQQLALKNWYHADIISPPLGGPSFEEIAEGAVPAKLFSRPVRIPSIAMLIRLKEKAVELESQNKIAAQKHSDDIVRLRKLASN